MKAILIDDEPLALDFLEQQIKKVSNISIVHKFVEFDMNRDAKWLEEINIIFLDIEMPGMNGIELAEKLLESKPSLMIVFVTAFHEYAVQAFEFDSLDYLVKPVQLDRLKKAIDRIENMINYYETKQISMNHLHINVCNELSFEAMKNKPEIVQWRTTKAQELFLYLLLHTGKTVRKSELTKLLWPEVDFNKEFSQLYTAIYHVRKTLNKFDHYFSLNNVGEGYHLSIDHVSIDIVEWENSIQALPPINAHSIKDYEKIMALYTGAYLQEYDYLWAEPERHRLEMIWLRTAHQMADFYLHYNYLESAELWYAKICKVRPEDEKAHLSLMNIYDQLRYGLLVDHQFNQYQNTLKELDLQISPDIQDWYNKWVENRDKITR